MNIANIANRSRKVVDDHRRSMPRTPTATEMVIVRCIGAGMTDKAIAAQLGLSYRTVRTHLERLYEREGIHSRAEAAVRFASAQTLCQ